MNEAIVNKMEKADERDLSVISDPLKMYLAEMLKYPVLTREQERRVAILIHEKSDKGAAQKLVVSNLKLVVKIAHEYYSACLDTLDLIQEGNLGLLHAVKKYNPYLGTRFCTYAGFWIRAYILRYIIDSWSLVKIGTTDGQRKLFFLLNKETKKLKSQGVEPTPRLLASSISVKEEEIDAMTGRLTYADLSLDTAIHDGSDDTMMDTIRSDDDVEEIVSERLSLLLLSKKIAEFKGTLDDRDSFIFNRRVMAEEPMTLGEIGSRFNISRERVRQVELQMISKLKEHFQEEANLLDTQLD